MEKTMKQKLFTLLVATCPHPLPENGQVAPKGLANGRYRINDIVTSFTCDSGYILVGDQLEITCQTSGTWDPLPPVCRGKREQKYYIT